MQGDHIAVTEYISGPLPCKNSEKIVNGTTSVLLIVSN